MKGPHRHAVLAGGLLMLLSGCGISAEVEPVPAVATTSIDVTDNVFEPATAEVAAGETVVWRWVGEEEHDIVADEFEHAAQTDGTFEHRFDEPGTYAYRCNLHFEMVGVVKVTETSS